MQYELYLKYDAYLDIGLEPGCWGDLCQHTWADIMYWTPNQDPDKEGDNTKIGIMMWATYNQSLAMLHRIHMTDILYLSSRKELHELEHTNISQETIDEVGAASNPNIVMIVHFGISAAFRKKGLGEEVVKGFIEQMKGKCGDVVIANNEPAQFGKLSGPNSLYAKQGVELDSFEKDREKAQCKLNAFWQRCGFRQYKNNDNVFLCNVDEAVAEQQKAKATAV